MKIREQDFVGLECRYQVAAEVSESTNVQDTGSSIGRGAVNGHRRCMNVSKLLFLHFSEVLLIPSYVGPNLQRYTVWQQLFGAIG